MDDSSATPFERTPVPATLPILCLRNTVVFPLDVVSVPLDRPRSIRLIEDSPGDGVIVGAFFPRDVEAGEINEAPELLPVGVACRVIHRMRMPNETVQVVLQGLRRIRLEALEQHQPYLRGRVKAVTSRDPRGADIDGLIYRCMEMVDQLVQAEGGYPPEMVNILRMNIAGAGRFADLIGAHVKFPADLKRRIAGTDGVRERLRRVEDALREALAHFEVQTEVQEKVRADLEGRQREHILRTQLKTIRQELGIDGDAEADLLELRDRVDNAGLPDAAMAAATRELDRLASMTPASSEYHVARTYVGWLIDLPWQSDEEGAIDLRRARRVLDRDHHGLQDVKERILEFLAVRRLTGGQGKAPVLCLSGPPGVGKTSLGRSIAEALGRRFVRMSVGGMRDEAEVKGHRRTYVGAMPGKVLQEVKRAKSRAPVFVIDEIDKMGSDARGDPSSAMLEVLDPEQNHAFLDHYLDVPFDLSQVFFLCTANVLESIPGPLRDRMEIVRLSGYTAGEKLEIARKHLVPRVLEENGLTRKQISFTKAGLQAVIEGYTREAGVRELHRLLGRICRRRALEVASGKSDGAKGVRVNQAHVARALGPAQFEPTRQFRSAQVGVTAGLAWTPVGGDLLFFEAALVPGSGQIKITGRLGEVMRESCETALSWLRANADQFDIPHGKFAEHDIHLHVPDGATPKDGPSAGVTIAACLASLLTGRPARADVAMTGEISLKGRVLPVGGIKEKVLAAHRAGMQQVILPALNEKDLGDLPTEVRRELDIRLTSNVLENLQTVLMPIFLPQPGRDSDQHLLPPEASDPGISAVR